MAKNESRRGALHDQPGKMDGVEAALHHLAQLPCYQIY